MISQGLLDDIKEARAGGQTDEQIKSDLLANNWPEDYLDDAFGSLKPRAEKRVWKIIYYSAGGLVGLIVLLNLIPFVLGVVTKDIAPLAVGDLKLRVIDMAKDNNAFYDLLALQEFTVDSDESADIKISLPENPERFITGKEWDEEMIEEVIDQNKEVFAIFDKTKGKNYQDPATDNPAKIGPDGPLPASGGRRREMAEAESLRALYLFKNGREQEGVNEAIAIIEFGQKMQDSQVDLIGYLASVPIKKIGLDTLATMTKTASLSSDQLVHVLKQLDKFKNSKAGLKSAFKSEYENASQATDMMISGTPSSIDLVLPQKDIFLNNSPDSGVAESFYFRPNESKKLFADWARTQIAAADKSCGLIKKVIG